MSVVENLFNHNVTITIPGGEQLTVDLSANPWNRTTVADGYWLQTKTVYPFSARDIYLANCIDDALNRISDVETAISSGTTNALISMNDVIYDDNDYWEGLPATVAPSTTSKAAPSNTLTYMTLGIDSDVATDDVSLQNDRTCLIQGNLSENSFNQLLMTDNGMFYRSISGNETDSVAGDKVDSYDVLTTNKSFSQILDDSTINSAGYWFLHKESSGRPVWTNINALGEYIDNRVNPDAIYIGWNDIELEYPERQLILIPPNENNTTGTIDPTSDTYLTGAYAWTEDGWSNIPPLMSRTEINERISEIDTLPPYTIADAGKVLTVNSEGNSVEWTNGGGSNGPLKDFLSLFTTNGAQAHYTNYGCYMQSEVNEDGRAYYQLAGSPYNYYYVESTSFPAGLTPMSFGAPRWILCKIPMQTSATVTGNSNTTATISLRANFTPSAGSNGYITNPIYIPLAPFTYLNSSYDSTDTEHLHPALYNNVPRDWHIHFVIKGKGIFENGGDNIALPAWADVSVVLLDKEDNTDSTGVDTNYITTKTSKTYWLTKGDALASQITFPVGNDDSFSVFNGYSDFTEHTNIIKPYTGTFSNVVTGDGTSSGISTLTALKPNMTGTAPFIGPETVSVISGVKTKFTGEKFLEIGTSQSQIRKEIDFYESFSALEINDSPSTSSYYIPYLRVCIKGISAYTGTSITDAGALRDGLAIEIQSTSGLYNDASAVTKFGTDVFIEQFTDDRFMQLAYKYANGTLTRRLSYQDNLLGVNATNPASTTNTNILGN